MEDRTGSTSTNAKDRLGIGRVRPGSGTVRIDALGCASRRIELELDGNVALDIELDVQPLDLGAIEAMRAITIRGRVTVVATPVSACPPASPGAAGGRS